MTIETYPEMNAKIIDLLRWDTDNPLMLYAAQRIEDLERELHDERIRRSEWERMYNQAIANVATLPCSPRGYLWRDALVRRMRIERRLAETAD